MANTMVQVIGKLSLKMGVLLRGSVYEQKKCVRSPSVFITLGTYPRLYFSVMKTFICKTYLLTIFFRLAKLDSLNRRLDITMSYYQLICA